MPLSPIFVLTDTSTLKASYSTAKNATILWVQVPSSHWNYDRPPTHYCCLNPEQITIHAQQIQYWLTEGRVRTAFLHERFLDFYPEAANDSRYLFLQKFYHTEALYGHDIFEILFQVGQGAEPADPTSGLLEIAAIFYAIRLGYQTIGLMGVARDARDAALRPLRALRDEIVSRSLNLNIVTCDRPSALHNHGIFPYCPLENLLRQQKLGALVVPTQVQERDRLLNNLKLWQTPAFSPFLHLHQRERVALIFTFTGAEDLAMQTAIRQVYDASPLLQRWFHPPEFQFFQLPAGEDVYVKDGKVPLGQKGFASGPNQQFFRSLFAVRDRYPYAFFMETDCLPLRPDWLGTLCDWLQTTEEFWVMGSHYRGRFRLFKHFTHHINGSAIYAVGNPEFMEFAQEWQAILDDVVANRDPIVAYDSVLDYFFYYEFVSDRGTGKKIQTDTRGWQLFQRTAAYFRYSNYILNYSSAADQIERTDLPLQSYLQPLREQHHNGYLVHNKSLCDLAHRQLL